MGCYLHLLKAFLPLVRCSDIWIVWFDAHKICEPFMMVIAFLFSELTSLCPILSWRFFVLSSLIPLAILSFDGRYWPLPPVLVETPLSLAHDTSISWSCRCFPCGLSCSAPTRWSPSTSPLLTPSSLPWQTPLCPGLPLGLPVGLLDSQIYISGLDLLSRSYTHRHSSLLR